MGRAPSAVLADKGKPRNHHRRKGSPGDYTRPEAFRILRAIWKLSFIKFDAEENQAFRNAILKLNQRALARPEAHGDVFEQKQRATHERIAHLVANAAYGLDAAPLVKACATDDRLRHEMALKAGLLHQLATHEPATTATFGSWDYLSHQVIASPFKPIDYMDKMDVFGSAYIPEYAPLLPGTSSLNSRRTLRAL